jgi:hypothetical protein
MYVPITDAGFPRRIQSPRVGTVVQFDFAGSKTHHITDTSGLIDTGVQTPVSYYRYTAQSAGTFTLSDTATEPRSSIDLKVQMVAVDNGDGTFTLTWGTTVPAGYVWDVKVKTPNGSSYQFLYQGTTQNSATLRPSTPGTYSFVARVYIPNTSQASGYSPTKTITV